MKFKNNYFILTGGPGSGKTSVIEALTKLGYNCISEVGRTIIQEQVSIGGTATPWNDREEYADAMLQKSIKDYINHETNSDICFFDRGIPDILGYVNLIEVDQKPLLIDTVKEYRYNSTVFIFPPWKEIYETDDERKQDFDEAIATYEAMVKVYTDANYSLKEVPPMSIDERVEFLLKNIKL